jgi:predicted transcriptional regulator
MTVLLHEKQEIYAKLCELLGEPLVGPIDILGKLEKTGGGEKCQDRQ